MEEIVNSIIVKDLKRILDENGVNFDKKLRKPALQEKLKEFLSSELTQLVTSKEEDISWLFPVWRLLLSKETWQWSFYCCVSKESCRTISDALEFQKIFDNETSDDEYNSCVTEEDSEISCSVSLASESSTSTTGKSKSYVSDPLIHITKSTFNFSMDMNQKKRARYSRLGFQEQIVKEKEKLICDLNEKTWRRWEKLKPWSVTTSSAVILLTQLQRIAALLDHLYLNIFWRNIRNHAKKN